MHCGKCNCNTLDGLCRWHLTAGGTLNPLTNPEALGLTKSRSVQGTGSSSGFVTRSSEGGRAETGGGTMSHSGKTASSPSLGGSQGRRSLKITSDFVNMVGEDELVANGFVTREQMKDALVWTPGGFNKEAFVSSRVRADELRKRRREIQLHASQTASTLKRFPVLSKRNGRNRLTILPMMPIKLDNIPTSINSIESVKLEEAKQKLQAYTTQAHRRMMEVCEPLDLDVLNRAGKRAVILKTQERLRLQGASQKDEALILQEMEQLLDECRCATPSES